MLEWSMLEWSMLERLSDFHFLRPFWLGALAPALALLWLLWRQTRRNTRWQDVIAPELIGHLLAGRLTRTQKLPLAAIFLAWLLAAIAMAGPTWEKLPQPVHKTESALVILLDLSPSMLVEDLKPSRLVRARLKLTDLLTQRREGVTALVAYAGEAHVVTPLTDDTATISSLLPALHPGIMPLSGSNTEMAVEQALQLFQDAGISSGRILLVTDGVANDARETVIGMLKDSRFTLSILGVGTEEGAPIPTANGGFAKDDRGGIVVAMLETAQLRRLASALRGVYTPLRPDEKDIRLLSRETRRFNEQTRQLDRDFDTWSESGPYLVLALLPILAFAFRRGWLLALALALPLPPPALAQAATGGAAAATGSDTGDGNDYNNSSSTLASLWENLWVRPDQQGRARLEQGDPAAAARRFEDPRWRGTAHYRGGDFEQAAEAFARGEGAQDHYNRANALAQAGRLDEAIEAYEQALDQDPDLEDAQTNLDIVRQLRDQQQQNQQSGQSQDGDNQQQQGNQQQGNQQQGNQQQGDQQQPQSGSGQNQDSTQNQRPGQQHQGRDQPGNQPQAQNQDQRPQLGERNRQNAGGPEENDPAGQPDSERDRQAGEREPERQPPADPEQRRAQKGDTDENGDPADAVAMQAPHSRGDEEQQQALEQWLRQVPDDPSGLMRNKFEYQYRQRRKDYRAGTWEPPENDANKRW